MSMILENSVFIHIPKTGGTFVREFIRHQGLHETDEGRDHATPDEISHETLRAAVHVFCFVRHPLSWYQSYWCYRMEHGWDRKSPHESGLPLAAQLTMLDQPEVRSDKFETFVKNCLQKFPLGWVTGLYERYTRGCTFVGKQEHLRDDLMTVLSLSGETYDPRILRAMQPENVAKMYLRQKCYYPWQLRDSVYRVERLAIQRYDYA